MKQRLEPFWTYILAMLGLSGVSVGFFMVGAWRNHSWDFWYLLWNLFLAWVPLVLAYLLLMVLRRERWSSWQGLLLTLLWLVFLPNSFYMVSDFIHLQDVQRVNLLYDTVMFTSFILNGLLLGYTSLYLVHAQVRKRLPVLHTSVFVGAVLLLCSFAIYLGRNLRWNTWDVLANPFGILFDVSDRILNPFGHPQTYATTFTFFVFLAGVYWVVWSLVRSLLQLNTKKR